MQAAESQQTAVTYAASGTSTSREFRSSMQAFESHAALDSELRHHGAGCPAQAAEVIAYREFLGSHPAVFQRSHRPGHFTASVFLVSVDGQCALLLHHAKLDRWLQPGGHADGDPDLAAVALREAEEETGLAGLLLEPGIFDLDRHLIPARGEEPEHWHWDVRYIVRCTNEEAPRINNESRAFRWHRISELANDESIDPSIRRMAQRWMAR